MNDAIGNVLPLGIALAFSPFPIIAMVLVLAGPRAVRTAGAFVVGALVGIVGIGAITILIADAASDAADDELAADDVAWLVLALGVAMLVLAWKSLRSRPPAGTTPEPPAWTSRLESMHAGAAVALGVVLCGINPKNLVIIVSAAASTVQPGITAGQQALAFGIFTAIGMLGILVPFGMFVVLGQRAETMLQATKRWMLDNNAVIMTVVCALIGARLIGQAIGSY